MRQFLNKNISQGSAAKHLRCGRTFTTNYYKFTSESTGKEFENW